MCEDGINGLVEVTVVEGELFTDGVFEWEPAVFDGIEVRGIRRQEFARAPRPGDELFGLLRLVKGGIVVQYDLSWLEDRHQTVLDIGLEKGGIAVALKDEGGDERVLMKGVNETDPLGAVAGLLPPTGLAPGTPAIGQGFIIVDPGLIHIDQLLHRRLPQLRKKLRPQCLIPLGIAKGLFLCV